MILTEWAIKWGVSADALEDLKNQVGLQKDKDTKEKKPYTESVVQAKVRAKACQLDMRLWRNNVGAASDSNGNFFRYGLCNDSKLLARTIKSSDLIGIRKVKIEPHMVGSYIGQFVAREVKRTGWRYTGTEREEAQLKFISFVLSMGGDAAFISDPDDLY